MPSYGKRQQDGTQPVAISATRGAASHFADCILASSETPADDEHDIPTVQKRSFRSAFETLKWNANCLEPQKRKQTRRFKGHNGPQQQLFLDFGQKDFGKKECRGCGMVYCPGLPEDEDLHKIHHNTFVNGVAFLGWKTERVVDIFPDGSRIVCVRPGDPHYHVGKANDVRKLAEEELGATGWSDSGKRSNQVSYLLVSSSKHVVGFLLVEKIKRAYRVVLEDSESSGSTESQPGENEVMMLSTEAVAATLGFSIVWVHRKHRGHGFGQRLLSAAVRTFTAAGSVPISSCAFSQPTQPGRRLATRFFGTERFLVYKSVD